MVALKNKVDFFRTLTWDNDYGCFRLPNGELVGKEFLNAVGRSAF